MTLRTSAPPPLHAGTIQSGMLKPKIVYLPFVLFCGSLLLPLDKPLPFLRQ